MKLSKDEILREILRIFPTQREAGEAIGFSESQMSHALKKPTSKFLSKLESVGVVIEGNGNTQNINSPDSMAMNKLKNVNIGGEYISEELKKIIEEKNEIIKGLKEVIEHYKTMSGKG